MWEGRSTKSLEGDAVWLQVEKERERERERRDSDKVPWDSVPWPGHRQNLQELAQRPHRSAAFTLQNLISFRR